MPFAGVHGFPGLGQTVKPTVLTPDTVNRLGSVPVKLIRERGRILNPLVGSPFSVYRGLVVETAPHVLLQQTCGRLQFREPALFQSCAQILRSWPNLTGDPNKLAETLLAIRRHLPSVMAARLTPLTATKEQLATLFRVLQAPSRAELEDLKLIDSTFPFRAPAPVIGRAETMAARQLKRIEHARQYDYCRTTPPTGVGIRRGVWEMGPRWKRDPRSNLPFFCTRAATDPFATFLYGRPLTGESARVPFWQIDLNDPWAKTKPKLMRALPAEKAIETYPWPSPGWGFAVVWSGRERQGAEFRNFVLAGPPKSWDDLRAWITLSVLNNYAKVIEYIQWREGRKAKKQKRIAIQRAVIGAAVGLMFAFLAPAVIGAAFSTVRTILEVREQRKAAKDMMTMAKQFALTDAAFAAEIERVANAMDAAAAEAEKAQPMTTPEVEAVQEAVQEEVAEQAGITVAVEGNIVGRTDVPKAAAAMALENSQPGDRFEFLVKGKPVALFIRTKDGQEAIPPEMAEQVRAMPAEELRALAQAREKKGFPWALVALPAAALVLLGDADDHFPNATVDPWANPPSALESYAF